MLSPQKLPLSSPLTEKFASLKTSSPAKRNPDELFNFVKTSNFRFDYDSEKGIVDFYSKKMAASRKCFGRIISFKVKEGSANKVAFQFLSAFYEDLEVPEEWICNELLSLPLKKNVVGNDICGIAMDDCKENTPVDSFHTPKGSNTPEEATEDLLAHKYNKRKYEFADLSKLLSISLDEINAFVPHFFSANLDAAVDEVAPAQYNLASKLEKVASESNAMNQLMESTANIKPILISIEGNIGAGKSYLLRKLRAAHPDWCFIDEPVDFWESLRNDANESLLEVFYKDKRRWSYTFQNCALLSRFNNIETSVLQRAKALPPSAKPIPVVFITERCLDTDHQVFAKMLHADGELDNLEFDLYQRWFALLGKSATKLSAIVYVDTVPTTCSDRINIRNRDGESGIPLEYLTSLDKFQRTWIDATAVPTVRTLSDEVEKVESFVANLLQQASV